MLNLRPNDRLYFFRDNTLAVSRNGQAIAAYRFSIPLTKAAAAGTAHPKKGFDGGISPESKPDKPSSGTARKPLQAGEHWITIHPHGEGHGVPVLIRENKDGSASVVGGAGGKLNFLHLNKRRSPEELKAKAESKKQQEKERVAALTPDERDAEKRTKIESKEYHTNKRHQNALETIAQLDKHGVAHGLTQEHLNALQTPPAPGASAEDIKQWQSTARDALKQVKRIHQAYEHKLVTDHDVLAAAKLGDLAIDSGTVVENRSHVAIDATGNEIGSLQQLPNGQWLAVSPDPDAAPQVFDNWKDAAKEHVRQVQLAEQGLGGDRTQDDAFYDPAQWVKEQPPEDLPEGFAFKPEAAAEIARLSHDRKTINRSEKQAQAAIAKGNPFVPGYESDSQQPVNDAEILASLKQDAKTLQDAATNNRLLDLADTADAGAIRDHIQTGGYSALADIASDVLKQNPVNRSLVDAIGHNEAAKVLAYQLRQTLTPQEYDRLTAAQAAFHAQNSTRLARATTEKVQPMMQALKETHQRMLALESQSGGNYTPDQQIELDNLTYQAEQMHLAVQQITGEAIGQLQAGAAVVAALEGKPKTLRFPGTVPDSDEESFLDRAGLILGTDYSYADTPDGSRVTVTESGIQKLGGHVSLEDKARYECAVAIKRGEYDEPDYLPAGFADRPKATFTDAATEAEKFDARFNLLDTIAQSEGGSQGSLFGSTPEIPELTDEAIETGIRAYIGARVANGDSPLDVKNDILSPALYAQAGLSADSPGARRVQAVANDMILRLASQAQDGTLKISESKLRSAMNAIGDEEALRQRKARGTDDLQALNAQTLDPSAAKEAAHRSLAAMPIARVLFKQPEQLTSRERRIMREYAITQVLGQELEKPDKATTETEPEAKSSEPIVEMGSLFGGPTLTAAQQQAVNRIQSERDRLKESISDRVKLPQDNSPQERARYQQELTAAQSEIDIKIAALNTKQEQIESGDLNPDAMQFGAKDLNQWQQFSKLMGGDTNAYAATLDALRDKFYSRFANAYGVISGKPALIGAADAVHADRLELAKLPEDARAEMLAAIGRWKASDRAKVQARSGGKWTSDPTLLEKLAELKGNSRQINLFTQAGTKPDAANTKRTTIGTAAEQQLQGILPGVVKNFEQVNAAVPIFPVTWGAGTDHATKQRASKFVQAQHKCGLHFGAGSGKSSIALGTFSDLQAQGKVKRSIVAVPSNILGQFVGEAATFLKPDTYNYSANIGWNQDDRIGALKDENLHIHFTTRESLANDLLTLVEKHTGVSRDQFATEKTEADRHELMDRALRAEGINPGDLMLAIDEAHDISVRGDAEASKRALAIESLAKHTPYYVEFTGTPVKNDLSEAYSFLHRMDPNKFSDPAAFRSQYGSKSPTAQRALQRVMAPYVYAASTKPRKRNPDGTMGRFLHMQESQPILPLAEAQKTGRQAILKDYETIAQFGAAVRAGLDHPPTAADYAHAWDDPAVRGAIDRLSSEDTYGSMSDEEKRATIGGQIMGASAIKNAALWRLYHRADFANNPKMQHTVQASIDRVKAGKQGVIFTASEKAAQQVRSELAAKGIRCGVLDGSLSPEQKDAERLKFSPISGEPQYDVLICTDAGQTGANLQRGKFLIHMDVPVTSKSYDQRSARIHRLGQKDDTEVITPMLDVPEERIAWARLERKGKLGRVFQGKSDRIDETGLSGKLR